MMLSPDINLLYIIYNIFQIFRKEELIIDIDQSEIIVELLAKDCDEYECSQELVKNMLPQRISDEKLLDY